MKVETVEIDMCPEIMAYMIIALREKLVIMNVDEASMTIFEDAARGDDHEGVALAFGETVINAQIVHLLRKGMEEDGFTED
jgi:hypothetical protein